LLRSDLGLGLAGEVWRALYVLMTVILVVCLALYVAMSIIIVLFVWADLTYKL